MNRSFDKLLLILIAAIVGTAMMVWLSDAFTVVRVSLGLLVVLVLPGYTLVELLMGRRTLGAMQHLFMTLMVSLAIAILGGLALNQLPTKVHLDSWVSLLASTIIGAGLLAWLLRHRRRSQALVAQRAPIRVTQLLLMLAAVGIAGGALYFAQRPANSNGFVGYTMLWLTPVEAAANQLQLGIDSKEFAATAYRLELLVDAQPVHIWESITLSPNQQWQAKLTLDPTQRLAATIEANLYRLDQPTTLYRHVVLRPALAVSPTQLEQ